MEKSERFGLVLSPAEKATLHRLADRERIPAAAVVRRLIWCEAERHGLLPMREVCAGMLETCEHNADDPRYVAVGDALLALIRRKETLGQ